MKYPFTPGGFVELQQELHALNHPQLLREANAIHADFIAWILAHFSLDAQQQQFLAALPAESLDLFAAETAFAVQHRLPVVLHRPVQAKRNGDDDDDDDDERGKIHLEPEQPKCQGRPTGPGGQRPTRHLCRLYPNLKFGRGSKGRAIVLARLLHRSDQIYG